MLPLKALTVGKNQNGIPPVFTPAPLDHRSVDQQFASSAWRRAANTENTMVSRKDIWATAEFFLGSP